MQAGSFGVVAAVLVVLGVTIALAITIGAPILAVPFFIVGFGTFLLVRGKRRTDARRRGGRSGGHVPTTEEASADPVADSSVPDVARTKTDART